MAILRIFPVEFEDKMWWFGAFSVSPQKFETFNEIIGFEGMWILPGSLSEKINFKFVINSKIIFSGDQKRKNIAFWH